MRTTAANKGPGKKAPRKVPFAVKIDGASEVVLTGDFTGWAKDKVRLDRDEDGNWRTVLELPQGEYQYRLLIDGEWRDDPAAIRLVPNDFAGLNCVLTVK